MVALIALSQSFEIQAAGGDDNRLIAGLNGSASQPLASGKAVFRKKGNRVRFSAEVEDLTEVGTIPVAVKRNDVGTAPVIDGTADLNLGEAAVPPITTGSIVTVFDLDTGALVASATF